MSATPSLKPQSIWASMPARVLWLQPPSEEPPLAEELRTRLAAVGLLVYTMAFDSSPGEACRAFDLIIMRVGTQTVSQVASALLQIRACNYAPLILLTDQEPFEWSLMALPTGADAVLSIHTPEEIILARSMALLRRWLASR